MLNEARSEKRCSYTSSSEETFSGFRAGLARKVVWSCSSASTKVGGRKPVDQMALTVSEAAGCHTAASLGVSSFPKREWSKKVSPPLTVRVGASRASAWSQVLTVWYRRVSCTSRVGTRSAWLFCSTS